MVGIQPSLTHFLAPSNMLPTWIEISQSALLANIEQLKHLQGPGQLGVVVKSNAYGHDMRLIASLLENEPAVSWLCTASIDEALSLRADGCRKNLLVMAYNDGVSREAIEQKIDIMVDDKDILSELQSAAASMQSKARVHLKVDIGLSRRGIPPDAVAGFAQLMLSRYPAIELVGIGAHVSDASSGDRELMCEQLDVFNSVLDEMCKSGITIGLTHALSSGVLTAFPHSLVNESGRGPYQYDLCRLGTHVYGLWKSERQKQRVLAHGASIQLNPVLAWKARIVDVREVPTGTPIGYGHTFVTTRPSRIACIPLGYADGYPRSLQKASLIIEGKHAPLVGRVSMNVITADVTDIPSAHRGSAVMLMGDQPGITVNELALQAGMINNEILTRINPTIKRLVAV